MRTSQLLAASVLFLIAACGTDSTTENATVSADQTIAASEELVLPTPEEALIKRAGAPLLNGLGNFNHTITTSDPGAQRYFNQGMVMASGFNHAESIRAFQAAQRLDPNCAMCFWGEALATGPNINVTSKGKAVMQDHERVSAYAAIEKAVSLKSTTSQAEKDYMDAQATRYDGDIGSDRAALDLAYAQAMRGLAAKYPEDDDVLALFAEALMNTMPWDYWLDAGNPKPETIEVITALETVMARNSEHALALHLYIHAVEASSNPGRAESGADVLANLVPGSGHLVHMPSHIYWRVGRYNDASEANVRAAKVDEDYIAQCNAQGFYPALYYPHNIHFLWASASMEGRSVVAIEAGEKVAANIRLEQIKQYPIIEFFHTIPLLTLVRFGHWDDILAEPQPLAELKYSNAIWHYARGVALVRKLQIAEAEAELAAMGPLMDNEAIYFLDGNDYPASQILDVAELLLRGELSLAEGELDGAIDHFAGAVAVQDALPYTEPPFWYYPSRQSLGHALLQAEKYVEAEAVYRKDLKQYPRNGWSLAGLALSLEGQGRTEDAAAVKERFDLIWARADVELASSVL